MKDIAGGLVEKQIKTLMIKKSKTVRIPDRKEDRLLLPPENKTKKSKIISTDQTTV